MGYDLHITRKLNWFDASPAIDLHDWLEYLASDPDLQHDGFAETPVASGDALRIESQGICIWKGYSGGGSPEAKAWLTWNAGNVVAKNPDEGSVKRCGPSHNLLVPELWETKESTMARMAE